MAANDDRHAAVYRLWPTINIVERGEVAMIAGLFLAPQGAHGADVVIGARTPVIKGCADGIEFLSHPADADTQQDPAARHMI